MPSKLFYRAVLFSKGKETPHVLTAVWAHHAALGLAYKRYRWGVVRVEAVLQNPQTLCESIAVVWDRNHYDSRPEAIKALNTLKADPAMMLWKVCNPCVTLSL